MRLVIPQQPLYQDVKIKLRKKKRTIIKLFNLQSAIILWKGTHNLNQRKKNENLETCMV